MDMEAIMCYLKLSHYLVSLLESVEQGLKSRKMSDKLEDPENPHDPHQADHLPRLPDDLKVLETLEEEGQVEGDDGADVDDVHRVADELELVGADDESHEELQCKEDDDKVVCHLDDQDHDWPLALALLVLLQLIRGGDDEGDGGQDHHGQREQGQKLGQLRGPRVLYSANSSSNLKFKCEEDMHYSLKGALVQKIVFGSFYPLKCSSTSTRLS